MLRLGWLARHGSARYASGSKASAFLGNGAAARPLVGIAIALDEGRTLKMRAK